MTSTLLGPLAPAIGSSALGQVRVDRYAAAPPVVAGKQSTTYPTKPWDSEPETAEAALTERVRVPNGTVRLPCSVPGMRDAVADDVFPVPLTTALA
ncbi:hypothetical protein [Streptomyces sp. NPDC050485]|uniref:hypothetical protein n=1 Tax=Streptomyces sp. NPDC050485 TaxID=3365617 RepID=UPI0037A10122